MNVKKTLDEVVFSSVIRKGVSALGNASGEKKTKTNKDNESNKTELINIEKTASY